MKNKSFYIGLVITLIGIAFVFYSLVYYLMEYFSHNGYNIEQTYGIVTDVNNRTIYIDYQVENKDYKGSLTYDYEIQFENDDYVPVYYDKVNPQIIYNYDYSINIQSAISHFIIGVIAILIVSYIFFKRNQLKNNSKRKPLVLVGFENQRLIFKEKDSNVNNLYYSKPLFSFEDYQEIKVNNMLDADMIYSIKHPSMWEIDMKSFEEVLNEKS